MLGFWHEQSRSDRDTYVRINWDQIQPGEESNFDREDNSGRYGPYDFDSLMHYGQFDFAIGDLPTITVLPPNEQWQTLIGQRSHLSRMDQMIMSFIYSYPNWVFVDRNYTGIFQFGTFLEPYRDFVVGVNNTPNGGVLWVQPGTYAARGTFTRTMTWQAPLGGVTLNLSDTMIGAAGNNPWRRSMLLADADVNDRRYLEVEVPAGNGVGAGREQSLTTSCSASKLLRPRFPAVRARGFLRLEPARQLLCGA